MKNQSAPAPYVPKEYNQDEDKAASDNVDVPPMHSILTKYNSSLDCQHDCTGHSGLEFRVLIV